MFRATMCPSSGETTAFMLHLVLVILYGWLVCRVECNWENCAPSWLYLRDYTGIHGQQNTQNFWYICLL